MPVAGHAATNQLAGSSHFFMGRQNVSPDSCYPRPPGRKMGFSRAVVGYADFLVDRIRWTASFAVIPGSLSRAIISSLVWPRLLASRMNTLTQAVLAAWASIPWNIVS